MIPLNPCGQTSGHCFFAGSGDYIRLEPKNQDQFLRVNDRDNPATSKGTFKYWQRNGNEMANEQRNAKKSKSKTKEFKQTHRFENSAGVAIVFFRRSIS